MNTKSTEPLGRRLRQIWKEIDGLLYKDSTRHKLKLLQDEEHRIEELMVNRNLRGQELEKIGNTQEAIKLYELNVADGADTSFPYERLALIYRKQKQFDEELRILKRAIEVFSEFESDVSYWQKQLAEAKAKQGNGDEPERTCPYCKKILDQRPKRQKKCPYCNNQIYVRTIPSRSTSASYEVALVTEDEAKRFDLLKKYKISPIEFSARKEETRSRLGHNAGDRDVIWAVFNERILAHTSGKPSINDLVALELTYDDMAMFVVEEDKDCFELLCQRAKMQLMRLRHYTNKVRISCSKSPCDSCRQLDGKIITVEEAMNRMPIPCRACTNKYCKCTYSPEPYIIN